MFYHHHYHHHFTLYCRLESREAGGVLLVRSGETVSKSQKTQLNLRAMLEAGDIELPRYQRAIGALYSKVNLYQRKRQAAARTGALEEDGAVENKGIHQNTRDVLVSLTQEGQVEESGRRRGQGRGTTSVRSGTQSRGRGGQRGRGGAGQEGQGPEARRRGGAVTRAKHGQGSSTGRGGRGGMGRGWVQSGDNRRKCLACNGEFSDRYIYHHLQELCPGRTQDETSENTAVAFKAEGDDA